MPAAPSLVGLIRSAPRLGLYIHLPFCSSLCPYCDFAVVVGREADHAAYLEALVAEARTRVAEESWNPMQTVFLGGGTPSLVDADGVAKLLDQMRDVVGFTDDVEISLEANPETVTLSAMRTLAAAGVNRVSIGAQSFDDAVLATLGRSHTAERIAPAVDAVRAAGILEINLDLIYGTPGESDESWQASLDAALVLEPTHLSTYGLTIEERTAFGTRTASGDMPALDEDALADRFLAAIDCAERAGMRQYEVSNFALPGHECRHNLGIWCGGDYLGLGVGAHSLRGAHRWSNGRALSAYLADPTGCRDTDEILDVRARAEEWLTTRIRLRSGFPELVGDRVLPGLALRAAPLLLGDLMERTPAGYLRTTRTGMLLENQVNLLLLG